MPKTDLCFVISHGFAARMLFQTGLVDRLTQQGRNVAIIAADKEDENLRVLSENERIEVLEWADPKKLWSENYLFKRKYYLDDIESNTALWEKHIRASFYNTSRHPWRLLRPYYYYLIYQVIKIFPGIRKWFRKGEQKYLRSLSLNQLIKDIDPALVVSSYPVSFLEAQVLFAANELNIPTLIHLLSWDNITCKGIFPVLADFYIVWGPIMKAELIEYYQTSEDIIYTCGVPHFDHHLQVKANPNLQPILTDLDLNEKEAFLLVAMSSPRFAPKEIDIVERLAQYIEENIFGNNLQLVIRPHPQNVSGSMADQTWINRLNRLKSDRVAIDYPKLVESKVRWSMKKADMDRLSNLLVGCSICLNSGSTVTIDAYTVNKPVILTSFDGDAKLNYWKSARRLIDYPHLHKLIDLGGLSIAKSYEDLIHWISVYLEQPNYKTEERKYSIAQECFKNDGMATQRVVDAINQILTRVDKK